jgi:2,5-diketo-D-gluconate reductase B
LRSRCCYQPSGWFYVELGLHKDEVDQEFRDFCNQHDITIVAYQPIKRQAVIDNETVQAIATAHDATPAQVALAWLIQMSALPIPKATNKAHIDENLGATTLKLTDQEMTILAAL